ncbi:MAG TPA: zinc-dependent metalloprotease family protein [Acidimicrobiales bacterium]|nr:zinc-dependent metalloprotease family protein [Acidimicrobiales bacterium]
MRRAALLGIALLLGAVLAPAGRAAVPVAPPIDEEIDCLEPAPRQVDLGATPLDGKRAAVDVLVLLDGVTEAEGRAAVKDAVTAYKPIGVDLRARFAPIAIPSDGTTEGLDGTTWPTASTDRAMTLTKRAVGGRVPPGVEVVYLLTAKELYLGENQPDADSRSYAIAGLADCIGGVAFSHRAFAIGERLSFGSSSGSIEVGANLPGKILAHEVGHLLGAHHHYANCAESVPSAAVDRSADVCTLMFNDVGVVSLRFSVLNRPVVRGHALTYAR